MSFFRSVLLIIASLLVGAVLVAVGAYWYARTASGQGLLRNFLVSQNKLVPTDLAASASSTPLSPPNPLLIPESYATRDYFDAINNVLQDLYSINATNAQFGPVLDTLNRQTLSCSYVGFYETMGRAHQLSNKNQTLIAQLSVHLSALATANVQTKDAVTKAQTQSLIVSGTAFTSALQQYASAANALLTGDTPTNEQIVEFRSFVAAATNASQTFADALKPLMTHIFEGVQAAVKAASSTPAR